MLYDLNTCIRIEIAHVNIQDKYRVCGAYIYMHIHMHTCIRIEIAHLNIQDKNRVRGAYVVGFEHLVDDFWKFLVK